MDRRLRLVHELDSKIRYARDFPDLRVINVILAGYTIVEVSDVQGGRIIISARASAQINGMNVDIRGVMLDAQVTGGIPSGTTLGVNGFASDLSLLNKIPGFSGSTSHWMAPEPVSSGILTVAATLGVIS